jgi:phenylacetate-CoA ligase
LRDRPELGEAIGLPNHALPMVFQFNPLDYYIETNDGGELIVSVCRLDTLSPKLRYNLHDTGCVVRFPQLEAALATVGVAPPELAPDHLDLPLLFHYGRSDSTVAFYGANVSPADVQEAAFSIPELQGAVTSFMLVLGEDDEANKTLEIAFELNGGSDPPADPGAVRASLHERLIAVNQDYREASRFIPPGREPTVAFHAARTGPFAGYDVRLKRTYISQP